MLPRANLSSGKNKTSVLFQCSSAGKISQEFSNVMVMETDLVMTFCKAQIGCNLLTQYFHGFF